MRCQLVEAGEKVFRTNPIEAAAEALRQAKLRFPAGTLVGLTHDLDEVGTVTGYNPSIDGYYPTARYPVMVMFSEGEMPCSFEMIVRA